jgi:putative transposase
MLDKTLTGWRAAHDWLSAGASVPQQQIIRDFGKARAKALKDIKARLPVRRRTGMPRFKKKDLAAPSLNYTRRGFRLKNGRLHLKVAHQRRDTAGKWAKKVVRDHDAIAVEDFRPRFLAGSTMAREAADAAISVTKAALIAMAGKHGRIPRLVNPAHTTMDCARCGARAKHALPLSERVYTCAVCGVCCPRDKNSAHVMLVRAGLNPVGVDRVRLDRSLNDRAA